MSAFTPKATTGARPGPQAACATVHRTKDASEDVRCKLHATQLSLYMCIDAIAHKTSHPGKAVQTEAESFLKYVGTTSMYTYNERNVNVTSDKILLQSISMLNAAIKMYAGAYKT